MAASYSITQSTFVLVSGRLGAIYGHQRLALIGLGVFGVFSIANGFCRGFAPFVAIRALSGMGGGIYMPNAITALGLMVPAGRRGTCCTASLRRRRLWAAWLEPCSLVFVRNGRGCGAGPFSLVLCEYL